MPAPQVTLHPNSYIVPAVQLRGFEIRTTVSHKAEHAPWRIIIELVLVDTLVVDDLDEVAEARMDVTVPFNEARTVEALAQIVQAKLDLFYDHLVPTAGVPLPDPQ